MSKALIKNWLAYQEWVLNDYHKRLELYKSNTKEYRATLLEYDKGHGSNLYDSSIRVGHEAATYPKREELTFENFMRWLIRESSKPTKAPDSHLDTKLPEEPQTSQRATPKPQEDKK